MYIKVQNMSLHPCLIQSQHSAERTSQKLSWLFSKAAKLSMAMQRLGHWSSFNFSYRLNLFIPSQKPNRKHLVYALRSCWFNQKIHFRGTKSQGNKHAAAAVTSSSYYSSSYHFSAVVATKSTPSSPLYEHIPASVFPDRWANGVCHIKTPDLNQQLMKHTCSCSGKILLTSPWPACVSWTLWPGIWSLGLYWAAEWGFAAKGCLYCKLLQCRSVLHSRTFDYVYLH